jgi:hypothetical protein
MFSFVGNMDICRIFVHKRQETCDSRVWTSVNVDDGNGSKEVRASSMSHDNIEAQKGKEKWELLSARNVFHQQLVQRSGISNMDKPHQEVDDVHLSYPIQKVHKPVVQIEGGITGQKIAQASDITPSVNFATYGNHGFRNNC